MPLVTGVQSLHQEELAQLGGNVWRHEAVTMMSAIESDPAYPPGRQGDRATAILTRTITLRSTGNSEPSVTEEMADSVVQGVGCPTVIADWDTTHLFASDRLEKTEPALFARLCSALNPDGTHDI